jgi:hypothetical protein
MIQASQHSVSKTKSTETDTALPVALASSRPAQPAATAVQASTKDAGRVHIGGGMMHF